MEFHMIDVIYAALPMCAQTEKTTFSCKDDQGKSLYVYWSGAKSRPFPARAYTTIVVLVFVFFSPQNLITFRENLIIIMHAFQNTELHLRKVQKQILILKNKNKNLQNTLKTRSFKTSSRNTGNTNEISFNTLETLSKHFKPPLNFLSTFFKLF